MNSEEHEFTDVDFTDIEQQLDRLSPRPVPARLKDPILEAVSSVLSEGRRRRRWDLRVACAAAALLVAGTLLNVFVLHEGKTNIAKLLDSGQTPDSIRRYTEFIETVTDDSTAQRVEQQLLAMTRGLQSEPSRDAEALKFQQVLYTWALTGGDWINAQALEDIQMDQHRTGDGYRGSFNYRRDPLLACELPA